MQERRFGGRGGRGGFSGSRPQETALLRSNILANQSNAVRRLQKDLKELRDAEVPLVGVSAAPLDDSIYTWHANIRGPEGTLYHGGVFHMQITFPKNYPCSPPDIQLFSDIPHPNVFGRRLCLDMFEKHSSLWYEGWTSAYTVEAILIQLQSFLFEVPSKKKVAAAKVKVASDDASIAERDIYRDAVDEANSFKCTQCKHRGPIEPYPPFNPKDNDLSSFIMIKDPKTLLEEEMLCFHSRTRLAETTLGVGVSISRLPRTGEIRNVEASLDLLCMRAFQKQNVRKSMTGKSFTHWLPLYFGERKNYETKKQFFNDAKGCYEYEVKKVNPRERMIVLLKKSLVFLTKGSTKKEYTSSMVLETMPKLIITHLVSMVEGQKHISLIAIRRLVNFIRLFRLLIELSPEVETEINGKLQDFIASPEKRIKDHCSSLGDLLAFCLISNKVHLKELLDAYLEEQLDRQAFWIIRTIPELDHTDEKNKGREIILEDSRNEVCFKTGLVGFHMTLIFFSLCESMESLYKKDMVKLCEDLDDNFGCFNLKVESDLQKKFQAITRVDNFNKYYKWLGIDCPDANALTTRLRKAIDNSRAKKYHGGNVINELPTLAEQTLIFLDREPRPDCKYDDKLKKFTLDEKDKFWQAAVQERFPWVAQELKSCVKQHTAASLALFSDQRNINVRQIEEEQLRLKIAATNGSQKWLASQVEKETVIDDYNEATFSWRKLFHKLCFEEMIDNFTKVCDFEKMYRYINVLGSEIPVLRLKVLEKKNLKSNFYYLMVIIGRLPALSILKLHQAQNATNMDEGGFKFLVKGFKFMHEAKRSLVKIQMSHNLLGSISKEYLYPCLKNMAELQVLKFSNVTLSLFDAKAIGKVLADFKNIRELDINGCGLTLQTVKEIADGLMRAKQLEIIKVADNRSMGKGVNTLIYNLAFSPKIKHIDLSGMTGTDTDTAEALYKLIKISGAIETLNLKNSSVMTQLTQDFFKAIGENKTLKYLNMDLPAVTSMSTQLANLSKGIAMNAKKQGNLEALSLSGWFQTYYIFQTYFCEALKVSDYDHEIWYGDQKLAAEMKQEKLDKIMHFKLKHLRMDQGNLSGISFAPKELQKQTKPNWPEFLRFVTLSPTEINMRNTQLVGLKDALLIQYAIGQNPVGNCLTTSLVLAKNAMGKEAAKVLAVGLQFNKSLLNLDLSHCNFGSSGVSSLCTSLAQNSTLKSLNLYRNICDVNGARAIGECLKKNCSLEFLDIGHNRIRQTGLKAICDGITANPKSKMTQLGVRANFINDDGFTYLFEKLVFPKTGAHLTQIFLKANFLSEYHKIALAQKTSDIKCFVDDFQYLDLLVKEKLDRTIWISPMPSDHNTMVSTINSFFSELNDCGFVTDVRVRSGKQVPGRKQENKYVIVEFAHENSIPRCLKLASKKQANFGGRQVRIYKAGTKTAFIMPSQRRKNFAGGARGGSGPRRGR